MDVKQFLGAFSAMIVRIAITVVVIIFVYKGAVMAYDFGYNVFADIPVSEGEGRTVSVIVAKGQSAKEVGTILEEKGLIKDKNLFIVQERLSDFHGKLQPGTYELNTAMTVADMIEAMCNVEEETK